MYINIYYVAFLLLIFFFPCILTNSRIVDVFRKRKVTGYYTFSKGSSKPRQGHRRCSQVICRIKNSESRLPKKLWQTSDSS